ncbi:MAG: 30S ribosome-binding factor RbfA [Firmicutes bacterium]|nr:30S ribosome-binding factor RbfA [Bacillota bacterium]
MATHQRVQRVREAIKQEASDVIRKMKDPRVAFVTVTDAEVSRDLRHVKIFVSVLGDDDKKRAAMEGLERATGYIRSEIGQRIRLRHTPEIIFRWDESLERGARISQLLRELKEETPDSEDQDTASTVGEDI